MAENTDQIEKSFSTIGLILRGMCMGMAEVIPGVSGGTIAFITGIYKTLIDSIKSIDKSLISNLLKFRIKEVWTQLNGGFLIRLVVGMLIGIIVGVFGITHLLESYPQLLWSLFFGLILASIPLMFSQMHRFSWSYILPFVIGATIAYGVTSISPVSGSESFLYIFFAGTIAISAFVLPGISGSFMLLILGLYTLIIPTLRSFLSSPELSEFILLAVFGLGCLTGLAVFSRIVSFAFEKYHDITIAVMSGFMLGSLNKIWPWRVPVTFLDKETQEIVDFDTSIHPVTMIFSDDIKILSDKNVLPADYIFKTDVMGAAVAFIVGVLVIWVLYRFQRKG